jgi:hypothetical protein
MLVWHPSRAQLHTSSADERLTVAKVRLLKDGGCTFIAARDTRWLSTPEYVKAESRDFSQPLCPRPGTVTPLLLDPLTVSNGTGAEQRFADVTEQWRGLLPRTW